MVRAAFPFMKPTLLILAAGMGSRYGGLKQLDAMGPSGEVVLDYSVFDAIRAGFGKVVFVIRRDFEEQFRTQIGARFGDRIQVEYAFQDLHDLPAGFSVPEGRTKPWGTAHAVLAAEAVVQEPFLMINADDFYGEDAFRKIAGDLVEPRPADGKSHYSMVGFYLKNTLSEHGSVARGVCTRGPDGRLASVTEMTKIFKTASGAENRRRRLSRARSGGGQRHARHALIQGKDFFAPADPRPGGPHRFRRADARLHPHLPRFRQGPMRGRDGNIHRGRPKDGMPAMISHLGSQVSLVAGMLFAKRLQGTLDGRVGATCIGDGASSTGAFHEGINLAAVEKLPLVVVIGNNQFAYSTPNTRSLPAPIWSNERAATASAASRWMAPICSPAPR
jgi:hypothetical protein